MTRWGALVIGVALSGCAHEPPKPPPRAVSKLADAPRRQHVAVSPPDWYWEPVVVDRVAKPVDWSATAESIVRVEGGVRVWDDLGDVGRERLRRDGVVVLGGAPGDPLRWQMGAFYNEWRERRVPYVITVDSLFALVRLALTRALAEIDARELAPLLDAMLARMDARLAAEQKGANVELGGGYRLARGIVAVARSLADERYVPSADLAAVVQTERESIDAHAGIAPSPLLGMPIDYARFAGAPTGKGSYRVLTWLSAATLALVARTEAPGAPLDVGTVRHHARAAMLVARLADRDVDAPIHEAFSRLARLFAFVWGPPDDLTPLLLGDLADNVSIDLAKPENITNVVRVDRVRTLARNARTPALSDGSAVGITVRFLGSHASVDATALPHALTAAQAEQIHASVHGSLVDALVTWSASSGAPTKTSERARAESSLAAWSLVHHVASSFGRTKAPAPRPPGPREIRVSGAPLVAFVEPEADAIALLLATTRQARRGLAVLGPLAKGSPADLLLAETEDIVKVALRIAERTIRDEAIGPDDTTALAAIPSRMTALEADAGDDGGPYAAVIHTDGATGTSRVSASGAIEPAFVVAREPGSGRLVLAVGAHLAHHEDRLRSDANEGAAAMLERRIKEGKAARAPWTESFRLAR